MAKKPTLKKDIRPKPQDTTESIASVAAVPARRTLTAPPRAAA